MIVAVALIAVGAWLWISRPWALRTEVAVPPSSAENVATTPAAAPTVRPTRFLNAAPGVSYIGYEACARCHPGEHESYLGTAHSQALAKTDSALEPPDASFVHAASGRTYEVLRKDGQLIHRESLPGPAGGEPIVVEHAMHYTIGSGHHSRSYLTELDGFLVESPLTWYASTKAWDMSPGYDRPNHSGFERGVDIACLYCHAGRVEPVQGSRFRMKIHEATIGCESCHGPGGLHAERHAGKLASGNSMEEDLTIVHPARLSRAEQESICGQCHLRGGATATVRGQRLLDFRPGMRMSDFHVDFVPEKADSLMKVVGHVEQMRASPCYVGSQTMTCLTCHDPHGSPRAEERVAYYRERCNACHAGGCKLEAATRLEKAADDNCVQCHMPQRPTDLAHFAFTHHRIGFHSDASAPENVDPEPVSLVPLSDISEMPVAEQDRLFGLAYLEFAHLHGRPQDRPVYLQRAQSHLTSARDGGADDAVLEAALAQLAWNNGLDNAAMSAARRSLLFPDLETGSHEAARLILADSLVVRREPQAAEEYLRPLIENRRMAEHFVLLAHSRRLSGNAEEELQAWQRALAVNPFRSDVHAQLVRSYLQQGDRQQADRHRHWAEYLEQLSQAQK